MANETILLVDDEEKVLSSLGRSLLDEDLKSIKTALNGIDALDILRKTPELSVIVADFHMPGINGIELLEMARGIAGDTTRILLTGVADLEMAVEAVNRGALFRFLIKPCPPETFVQAVQEGIHQNQLIKGERELLSNTLNGSIKVMVEIMAVSTPDLFSRANRLRKLSNELAKALQITDQAWEIELSALLCQIGAVTVPKHILLKWQSGAALDGAEREMIRSIPKTGAQLIRNIPRLENIAKYVAYQDCTYRGQAMLGAPTGDTIPLGARILKVIIDFDRTFEVVRSSGDAFLSMLKREWEYDPYILDVFEKKVIQVDKEAANRAIYAQPGEKKISVEELKLGMELSRDIIDKNGIKIVAKGTAITEVLRYKLINYFHSKSIVEAVFIECVY
jgi:response regulator RpfG family c-di-GMP phosphodiesterase